MGMSDDESIKLPDTTKKLELKGEVPAGEILITKEGKVAIAVYNNRYCVTKGLDDKDVTVTEDYKTCELPKAKATLPIIWTAGTDYSNLVQATDAEGNIFAYKISDYAESIDSLEGASIIAEMDDIAEFVVLTSDGGFLNSLNENIYEIASFIYICESTSCEYGNINFPNPGTYVIADNIEFVSLEIFKEDNSENTGKTISEIGTTTFSCVTSGKCTQEEINTGIKVNVQVNDKKSYDFYVVADDGEKLTLIMDRNLGNRVAWYKDNDDTTNDESNNLGPVTALKYLNSETETWSNIAPINSYEYINNDDGTTNNKGYQKLKIINGVGMLTSQDESPSSVIRQMRARMLTEEEISALAVANSDEYPKWIFANLDYSNTIEQPLGYWLLTGSTFSPSQFSVVMSAVGLGTIPVYDETSIGARPVIEISK